MNSCSFKETLLGPFSLTLLSQLPASCFSSAFTTRQLGGEELLMASQWPLSGFCLHLRALCSESLEGPYCLQHAGPEKEQLNFRAMLWGEHIHKMKLREPSSEMLNQPAPIWGPRGRLFLISAGNTVKGQELVSWRT